MNVNGKSLKVLFISLTVLGLLYGGYYLLRGAELAVPSMFREVPGGRLLMSMEGFRFTLSENGRVSWRMKAMDAELYENKEAQLREIEIDFTGLDKAQASLLGENGTMDTVTGDAAIRRGGREVRIVTSDGYLMTTNSLFWKAGERLVRTADPFKILGKEIYFEGKGLSADVDMRKILVSSNVKAVLQE